MRQGIPHFGGIPPKFSKNGSYPEIIHVLLTNLLYNIFMIKVNMISETEFTVKGHGVHTAYLEITNALKKSPRVHIEVNSKGKFDVIHIQTMGLYAITKLLKPGPKKVVSAHLVPDSFLGSIRWAEKWRWAAEIYLKWFYSKADLVLACSGSVRQELEESMHLKNTDVLYNSIDMARYHRTQTDQINARDALGIHPDRIVILGNGQLQPRKRFDLFHDMAILRPDYQFIWVGGIPFGSLLGADAARMTQLVESAPANLKVTGIIDLEEVRQYYHAADIFTLPAEQENHPMCVLEAAGTGLPIVLRDIWNYRDTFYGGAVMAKTDDDFLREIDRLANDPAYRVQWGEKSKLIEERFDSKNSAERLIQFYEKLLS